MMDYPTPIATVDVVLLTLRDGALNVLLVRRENEPYKGRLALPGGYVHVDEDEDLAATACRVLRQKAGLSVPYLEQLCTFSGMVRDPRGWSLSVAYYALVPEASLHGVADDSFEILPVDRVPALPFDHGRIIEEAVKRLRGKSTYSSLPCFLLPEEFTLAELQRVYERVLDVPKLDTASFRRKIEEQGVITAIPGKKTQGGQHRPAQLYRMTNARLTEFDRAI